MGCSCNKKQIVNSFLLLQNKCRFIVILHSHDKIALHIFSYLTLPELGKASAVCRQFNKIAGSQQLLERYRKISNDEPKKQDVSLRAITANCTTAYVPQPNEDCEAVMHNTEADNVFFAYSNLNSHRNDALITPKFCTLVNPAADKSFLSERKKSVKCIFIISNF
jgi:hypothetical protein